MNKFKFTNHDDKYSFQLDCIASPTYMETEISEGKVFSNYFAIAEDDNSLIVGDNLMMDDIFGCEVEYEGVIYRIEDSVYPENTTYKDHINKNIKCMIFLSLIKI